MIHFKHHPSPLTSLKEELKDVLKTLTNSCEIFTSPSTTNVLHLRQDPFLKHSKLLHLGTGGSSLGAKALSNLCDHSRIIYNDNSDPHTWLHNIRDINWKETGVLVVSKSGETLETLAFLFSILESIPDMTRHVRLITDPKQSLLRDTATHYRIPILDHPESIGGRFSVFSVVGLYPALFEGLDVESFLQGVQEGIQKDQTHVIESTLWLYEAILQGKDQLVFWIYSDRLMKFGNWCAQLYAESLGKRDHLGKRQGITPLCSQGTADQHSLLQLYYEGPQNKCIRFLSQTPSLHPKIHVANNLCKDSKLHLLHNKSLSFLFHAHFKAVHDSLESQQIPIDVIEINTPNEYVLGRLMVHAMMEVLLLAHMLNVNPFDQPSVEDAKKRILQTLKKDTL